MASAKAPLNPRAPPYYPPGCNPSACPYYPPSILPKPYITAPSLPRAPPLCTDGLPPRQNRFLPQHLRYMQDLLEGGIAAGVVTLDDAKT